MIIILTLKEEVLMRISFIGAGNMAGAIIKSIIKSGKVLSSDVYLYDKISDKMQEYVSLGCNACQTVKSACDASNVIVLAVKPQDYTTLLHDIKSNAKDLDSKTFVSIAAAISTEYICKTLEVSCPVVRVMPNTPLLLGVGATAISRNSFVSDKNYTKICTLFASSGIVCTLPEEQMNSVISVNSTSPVYVYMLAKAMIDGAVEQGLDLKNSTDLVYQTILGAAKMLKTSGFTPEQLIKMVASPSGTTEAAIKSLENNNFNKIIYDAMVACTDRANEIGL